MGYLNDKESWDKVPYFAEDAVLTGGPDCPDNVPIQALANRTAFLKQQAEQAASKAQPLSPDLSALAGIKAAGFYVSTGPGTAAARTLTAGQGLAISNADGKAGNPVVALANSGVEPGSYGMLVVDAMGRATGGRQMTAADVPALDWSKIASGKPKTMAGYGISDAYSKTEIDNRLNGKADKAKTLSGYGIADGATKGELLIAAPPGEIAFFAMNAAPAGWLVASGAAVSRATYAALFAAIGTSFGAGDGSKTFNLPDLRGQFVRGWSGPTGLIDPGRPFGSVQTDMIKLSDMWSSYWLGASPPIGSAYPVVTTQSAQQNASYQSFPSSSNPETRPRNIALLACIKI